MTSSFRIDSHQATLEEDVTLLNGQTSSSLTAQTSGLPEGQLSDFDGSSSCKGKLLLGSRMKQGNLDPSLHFQ
jgi:hypothetical protein